MKWLIALALALAVSVPVFAGNPKGCPTPNPLGWQIDARVEERAWKTAKRLADAPKAWKKPGFTVFYGDWFTDSETGDVYAGFYLDPEPYLNAKTGEIVSCEYIQLYIPSGQPHRVLFLVLTHEYLHALALRLGEDQTGCSTAEWEEDGCETWIQSVLPVPDWWEEN